MNYSKQRELIYDALSSTREHPTAETLYRQLRERSPKLSLATVYRNLSQLCDMGQARRLRVNGSPDRFDANPRPHYHFCCGVCGKVSDVDISQEVLNTLLSVDTGCRITDCDVIFYGTCASCVNEEDKIKD